MYIHGYLTVSSHMEKMAEPHGNNYPGTACSTNMGLESLALRRIQFKSPDV